MKKVLSLMMAALLPLALMAQGPFNHFGHSDQKGKVSLEYGAYFDYYFENQEHDAFLSTYYAKEGLLPIESGTDHAMVLTPSIGFSIYQGPSVHHRLNLGLDLLRNMGAGPLNWQVIDELTFHYDGHVRLGNGAMFEGILGVFPHHYREGEYGDAFFDSFLLFNDRNMDGILLKYKARKFYAELGADWMGRKDGTRRERFMIISAGNWQPLDWLDMGWSGTFYHYASSEVVHGVVDNDLLEPYVRVDLGEKIGFQDLSFKLGGLFSYQWDRVAEASQSFPMGFETVSVARKWNVYLANTTYAGDNLQYLYHHTDAGGIMYGTDLYFGDPFYQCRFFDVVEVGWEPDINDYMSLNINFQFDFSDGGFLGWKQQLCLIFDLDRIRHKVWGAGRIGEAISKHKRIHNGHVFFM